MRRDELGPKKIIETKVKEGAVEIKKNAVDFLPVNPWEIWVVFVTSDEEGLTQYIVADMENSMFVHVWCGYI